jgi:TolA-binding protein
MTKKRIRTGGGGRRRTRAAAVPVAVPPSSGGGAGVVIGIIGWLFAVGTLGFAGMQHSKFGNQQADIRRDRDARLEKLQADVKVRQETLDSRRKEVAAAIAAEVDGQSSTIRSRKTTGLVSGKMAEAADEVAGEQDKLAAAAEAKAKAADAAGVTLSALQKEVRAAEKEKRRLKNDYARRYRDLRNKFEAKAEHPEPAQIKLFFKQYAHSPFGPAAGFLAAEKLYERGELENAARQYQEVIRRYPQTGYATQARTRAAQAKGKEKFEKTSFSFEPYKALSFVR